MSARTRTRPGDDLVDLLKRATDLAKLNAAARDAKPRPSYVTAPAALLLRDVVEALHRRHGRLVHLSDAEVQAVTVRADRLVESTPTWTPTQRALLVVEQLERLVDGSYASESVMRAALRALKHPGGADYPRLALRDAIAALPDSKLVRCTLGCGEVGPASLEACPWCGDEGMDPPVPT